MASGQPENGMLSTTRQPLSGNRAQSSLASRVRCDWVTCRPRRQPVMAASAWAPGLIQPCIRRTLIRELRMALEMTGLPWLADAELTGQQGAVAVLADRGPSRDTGRTGSE